MIICSQVAITSTPKMTIPISVHDPLLLQSQVFLCFSVFVKKKRKMSCAFVNYSEESKKGKEREPLTSN
jgi:hypothetical protein